MRPAMNEEFSGARALIESGAQALFDRLGEDANLEARLRSHEAPKRLMAISCRGRGRAPRTRLEGESGNTTKGR